MTGHATTTRVRVWLARLFYPGKLVYVERGHQSSTTLNAALLTPGALPCNYCGALSRDWPTKPCRTEAGKLVEPSGFRVYVGATK